MTTAPFITANNLATSYLNASSKVFEGWSCRIEQGEFYQLDLPSGSGKSSLFYVLLGLLPVQAGTLSVRGQSVSNWTTEHWSNWRKELSIQLQAPLYLPDLSLQENIVGWWASESFRAKLPSYLDRLGLDQVKQLPAQRLSGGQTQKMVVLKALAKPASLYLFDEPLNHQSVEDITLLLELIQECVPTDSSTIIISHQSLPDSPTHRYHPLLDGPAL